jgi:hypothetical protein
LDEQEQCCKEEKASCAWPAWQRPTRSAADTNARYRPRPSLSFPIVDRPSDAKAGRIVPTAAARLICARLGLMCVSSVSVNVRSMLARGSMPRSVVSLSRRNSLNGPGERCIGAWAVGFSIDVCKP